MIVGGGGGFGSRLPASSAAPRDGGGAGLAPGRATNLAVTRGNAASTATAGLEWRLTIGSRRSLGKRSQDGLRTFHNPLGLRLGLRSDLRASDEASHSPPQGQNPRGARVAAGRRKEAYLWVGGRVSSVIFCSSLLQWVLFFNSSLGVDSTSLLAGASPVRRDRRRLRRDRRKFALGTRQPRLRGLKPASASAVRCRVLKGARASRAAGWLSAVRRSKRPCRPFLRAGSWARREITGFWR
jgi:hypothetical protein